MYALVPGEIYTGDRVERGRALVVEGGRIRDLVPVGELGAGVGRLDLSGRSVVPGFIDLQVNGGGGVLFNDAPTVETLERIVAAHQRFGTTDLLPTYVTGPRSGMGSAIEAVRSAVRGGVRGVLGLHLEGPFISEAKAGAHDRRFIRGPNEEDLALMCGPREGALLVTLAPEVVSEDALRRLLEADAVVSLGHTHATCEEAMRAFANGATCVTHLYNAMSGLVSRAPGMVGAALDHRDSWAGIIVDGFHVDYVSVRVALRAKAPRKMILVTDAMPPVGAAQPMTGFRLGEREVRVEDGRCVTGDGVLAGSTLDMATAVRNCVDEVGLPKDEALRMASTYPAELLGLDEELGRVAPGYRAHLTVLDDRMRVTAVVVDGEYRELTTEAPSVRPGRPDERLW